MTTMVKPALIGEATPSLLTASMLKTCVPTARGPVVNVCTPCATLPIGVLGVGERLSKISTVKVSATSNGGSTQVPVTVLMIFFPKYLNQGGTGRVLRTNLISVGVSGAGRGRRLVENIRRRWLRARAQRARRQYQRRKC